MVIEDLAIGDPQYAEALAGRAKIIEQLADYDDSIASKYLEEASVSTAELKAAIKRAMLSKPDKVCISMAGRYSSMT